jgi:hypothetical protein
VPHAQVRQLGAQVLAAREREVEDDAASRRRALMEKLRVSDYQIINWRQDNGLWDIYWSNLVGPLGCQAHPAPLVASPLYTGSRGTLLGGKNKQNSIRRRNICMCLR